MSPDSTAPAAPVPGVLRALLVEDNPDNQALLQKMLERFGFHVTVARDGADGLARFRPGAYDLVVTDLEMPVLDGYAFTHEVRARESRLESRVPLLVVTAQPLDEHRPRCLEAGADAVMSKPVRLDALRIQVDQRVDRRPVVLVVDDDPDFSALLAALCTQGTACRVVCCKSGEAALEGPARARVNAVLLDMHLGNGLSGPDTAQRLRQQPGWERLPIVGLSASPEYQAPALEAGCTHFLSKPLQAGALDELLRKLLTAPTPSLDRHPFLADPDLADLVPAFLCHRREDVAKLRAHLDQEAWSELFRMGHNLKGSAASYGFPELSELGAQVERAAKRSDPHAVRLAVAQLEVFLDEGLET